MTSNPWCYYCDTRYESDLALLRHQRAKHFLCKLCDPKEYSRNCLSLGGLVNHVKRTHRTELTDVPGAIPGRKSIDVEVLGMKGIPPAALESFEFEIAAEKEKARWGDVDPRKGNKEEDIVDDEDAPAYAKKKRTAGATADESAAKRANVTVAEAARLQAGFPFAQVGGGTPFPELAMLAKTLASQLTEPHIPDKKPPKKTASTTLAFDPSMLAKRIARAEAGELSSEEEEVVPKAGAKGKGKAKGPMWPFGLEEETEKVEPPPPKPVERWKPTAPPPKPVERVDKNVVGNFAAAAAQRAQAAVAAEARKKADAKLKAIPLLASKLNAMDHGDVLKYAKEVGVNTEEINSVSHAKDAVTKLILKMESEESWMVAAFNRGKIGIKADWVIAKVKSVVAGGQGETLGIKAGMTFLRIDEQKFTKELLKERIASGKDYRVIFATLPAASRDVPVPLPSEYEYYSDEQDKPPVPPMDSRPQDDAPMERAPRGTAGRERKRQSRSEGQEGAEDESNRPEPQRQGRRRHRDAEYMDEAEEGYSHRQGRGRGGHADNEDEEVLDRERRGHGREARGNRRRSGHAEEEYDTWTRGREGGYAEEEYEVEYESRRGRRDAEFEEYEVEEPRGNRERRRQGTREERPGGTREERQRAPRARREEPRSRADYDSGTRRERRREPRNARPSEEAEDEPDDAADSDDHAIEDPYGAGDDASYDPEEIVIP